MKTKTSIIAAISLAAAGLSQAAVPAGALQFDAFNFNLVNPTPGNPSLIQVNPGDNAPNVLPAQSQVAAIYIEITSTVAASYTGSADQNGQNVKLAGNAGIILGPVSFNYTTDGSNGTGLNPFSGTNVPNYIANSGLAASLAPTAVSELWTVTDVASFFDGIPETFVATGISSISIQGTFSDLIKQTIQGGGTYNVSGKAYYVLVPEPSSAALGVIGMSMILLRRRR